MVKLYDLHSHTKHSDGTLSPTSLLKRASRLGVNVLAITDHDTVAALAEGQKVAEALSLQLINGVELSTIWGNVDIHILGLNIDPKNEDLVVYLRDLEEQRELRAQKIGVAFDNLGIPGAYRAAKTIAKGGAVGRPHFAIFLVRRGFANTIKDAFNYYLVPGRPGYVPTPWPSISQAVDLIKSAGGVSVIAHPMVYRLEEADLLSMVKEFKDAGGDGIEVVTSHHTREQIEYVARLATKYKLYASTGSDFHNPNSAKCELGSVSPLPGVCTPIWECWK